MTSPENKQVDLNLLFLEARSQNGFLDKAVSDDLLRQAYEIARMAPTSANNQAGRILFVKSAAAKEKLLPAMSPGNLEKTKAAPVTAIIAHDVEFYEKLTKLFPSFDMRSVFAGMPKEKQDRTAFQTSSLQGAYFMIAARALGLDCGPMGGFDNAKVDAAFFPDGKWKSNFLVNLGYGDPAKLFPRNPRLDFDEACRID